MKILQTPPRFYPYIGGVENCVYYLSKELVKLGHELKVICANEPKSNERVVEGINVKRLAYAFKVANTNITLGLPAAILKEDFDLMHTHLPTPWSADWSALISLAKRKPLVLHYYNNIVGTGAYSCAAKCYNHTMLPVLLNLSDKIIVTHERYIEYSPLKNYLSKVVAIPIGVDLERFRAVAQKARQPNVIFFLALLDEFHRYKGLDYLIRALAIAKEQIPDIKLIVGGDGSLRGEYTKLAFSLGLKERINFVGFVSHEQSIEYYNNCDAFILPTTSFEQEGFGIVLLEAMACGKPVITTEIPGPAEKIKEYGAGIIVRSKDAQELAGAIKELFSNQNDTLEMGRRARKLVEEQYSWQTIARKIEDLYFKTMK